MLVQFGLHLKLHDLRIGLRLWRRILGRAVLVHRHRIVDELIRVAIVHQTRKLFERVEQLYIVHKVRFAAEQKFLLVVRKRHQVCDPLTLASRTEPDVDRHVVAGLPLTRIDAHPLIAKPDRL